MIWPRGLAIALAAAPLPAAALAQDGGVEQAKRYEEYIQSRPYLGYVEARLNEMEPPPLKAECPAIKVMGRETSFMVKDVRFAPGAYMPHAGQWVDRLSVDRCGKRATRNILIAVREKEKLTPAALIPGRTATSPLLQRDAMRAAVVAARVKSGCQDEMFVVDSAIDGRFQPGAPWREDWTFMGCKATVVVGIAFTPDGRGGSDFSARAK
ncbi:MAG: hypothetical protein ACT4N4_14625 [Rhodospirillales bacterium]